MKQAWLAFQNTLLLGIMLILLTGSTLPPARPSEAARQFTRALEFDYVGWTVDALLLKLGQANLATPRYLTGADQVALVKGYIQLVQKIDEVEHQIEVIYADPNSGDRAAALKPWQDQLADLRQKRGILGPVAEEIFQRQISDILDEMGLGVGGQPLPPVLYHTTPLPYALIVSPRSVIRQDENISLDPDLTLDQMVAIENRVEKSLDVSALVSPIGGIALYPTMVMSTSDIPWLGEVVSHEWTHNFLSLRPLGLNYFSSGQLRTMNETTANIVGHEVSLELLRRYYPEHLPKATPTPQPTPQNPAKPTPTPAQPKFSFNKEMHLTRVTVDQMLKDGKIDEAEAYMEARRKVFWDHGYLLRKLNQAYFAFNGAYADAPEGGAAGADPVGPAVQELRRKSRSLVDFLNRISWMSSFAELQAAVGT